MVAVRRNLCNRLLEAPEAGEIVGELASQLVAAPKFLLPENGFLHGDHSEKARALEWPRMRLPYPAVVLEFTVQIVDAPSSVNPVRPLLLFVSYATARETREGFRGVVLNSREGEPVLSISMFTVWDGHWRRGAETLVYLEECGGLPIIYPVNEEGQTPVRVSMVKTRRGKFSEESPDHFSWSLIDVVRQFCALHPVARERAVESVAPALQHKRVRRHRLPFFEYRMLELPGGGSTPASRGGTHASPRFHWRRGHWRRCESGKTTWVTHCPVGDPTRGVVRKDYAVHKEAKAGGGRMRDASG